MTDQAQKASGPPVFGKVPSCDLDFVPDAKAAILEQSPRGGRLILWVTFGLVIAFLIWASGAAVDEVTKGLGKVIPSKEVQVVQNLEGGILAEILVTEGQVVDKGQILLRIDDTRFASSLRESRLKLLALKAKVGRLKAEAEGVDAYTVPVDVAAEMPILGEEETRLFLERRKELQASLDILDRQRAQRQQEVRELEARRKHLTDSHKLARKELDLSRPLQAHGAISEVEILRLERQVNDLHGELEETRLAIPRAQAQLDEAGYKVREQILSFRNKARTEYNQVEAEVSGLTESGIALEDRVHRTAVRSPLRGTVKQLMINTVGGVIQPGMDLVEIVPLDDSLVIEVDIRPQDIAFLRPQQIATVKFTAYDFAIYGGLKATVEQISADTIENGQGEHFYLVKVRTEQNYFGNMDSPLPVIPGMTAEVDILSGKKTVLDYLLKPVLRAKEYALRER